mgnify:CR=1 FL=1
MNKSLLKQKLDTNHVRTTKKKKKKSTRILNIKWTHWLVEMEKYPRLNSEDQTCIDQATGLYLVLKHRRSRSKSALGR